MGCLGRLRLFKCSSIAPLDASAEPHAVRKDDSSRRNANSALDRALTTMLQAARLPLSPAANQTNTQQLPSSLVGLIEQGQEAVDELQKQGAARSVLATIKQASEELLRVDRQSQVSLNRSTVPGCPTADALLSTVGSILFAQVVLDTAAVLQRRHHQLQQLARTLGFSSCSSLSACLQPATRAIVAGVVLGGHAKGDEVKVSCTVRRDSAFWDALGQLQQQGILQQQHQDSDQADGRVMLAKLFPRFVDDQLSSQQHQQQGQPLVQGLPGANSIPSSMWSQQPFAPSVSASVEAGEGHGPRKEFFQAAAHNWTTAAPQQPALLVYLKGSGTWWLNSSLQCTPALQRAYWGMGWLMAQALTNKCTLGLPVAPLLFCHIAAADEPLQPSLELLQQHDQDAATGIRSVLKLPTQQYHQLLEVEQLPSNTSRQQYVAHAVRQLLVTDVQWQLQAVKQGFAAGTSLQVLSECCLQGSSLAVAICGVTAGSDTDFRVQEAFRVVMEDEEEGGNISSSTAITCMCLWSVLDSWNVTQKKAFVKFVTGTDRLPAHPGSEQLVLSFPFFACGHKDQLQLLGTLPQSHTCSNTLELPDYAEALMATQPELKQEWSTAGAAAPVAASSHAAAGVCSASCPKLWQACRKLLDERLQVAVTCTSYGLDGS